jgi:hypothetical protein
VNLENLTGLLQKSQIICKKKAWKEKTPEIFMQTCATQKKKKKKAKYICSKRSASDLSTRADKNREKFATDSKLDSRSKSQALRDGNETALSRKHLSDCLLHEYHKK